MWIKQVFRCIDNWLASLTFFGLLATQYDDYDIATLTRDEEANHLLIDEVDDTSIEIESCSDTFDNEALLRFHFEFHVKPRWLKISQIKCQNLPPTDFNGKSDPFVEATIRKMGNPSEKTTQKTEIVKGSLNPVFHQELHFGLEEDKDLKEFELIFKVKDEDLLTNEKVGVIVCPLKFFNVVSNSARDYELPWNLMGQKYAGFNDNTAKLMLMNSNLVQQVSLLKMKVVSHVNSQMRRVNHDIFKEKTKQELAACESVKNELLFKSLEATQEEEEGGGGLLKNLEMWHSDIPSTRSSPLPMDADKHMDNSATLVSLRKEVETKTDRIKLLQKEMMAKDKKLMELTSQVDAMADQLQLKKAEEGSVSIQELI